MKPRLFHFSVDDAIGCFVPRPVSVPRPRAPGRAWLNGPLVWAVDEPHQPMYLFPRDCPRVLIWRKPESTEPDVEAWFQGSEHRVVAFIEAGWLSRFEAGVLHRYELPTHRFRSLDDAGMWVSRSDVQPLAMTTLTDLPDALAASDIELRVLPTLATLRGAWDTSLHASGIRLRNAKGGWT